MSSFQDFDFESKYGKTALNRLHDGLSIGVISSEILKPIAADSAELMVRKKQGEESLQVFVCYGTNNECPWPLQFLWQSLGEEGLISMASRAIEKLGLTKDSQQSGVKKFFNRLLMLPVPEQNLLFAIFNGFLDDVIADAKRAGTFDQGKGAQG